MAPALRFLVREDLLQKVTEVEPWVWCLPTPRAEHNAWLPQQIFCQHQVRTQVGCRHTSGGQGVADRPEPSAIVISADQHQVRAGQDEGARLELAGVRVLRQGQGWADRLPSCKPDI